MRGAIIYGPGDVRFDERDDPVITEPTDAVIRTLATHFGATDIVAERGQDGIAQIRELTDGIGADAVLECVGTEESVAQALPCARPGAVVGWVGVPHVSDLPQQHLFWRNAGLRGGPAPVRAYLPDLPQRVLDGRIEPGKVFDVNLPLERVSEASDAMDQRRSVKTLLQPAGADANGSRP